MGAEADTDNGRIFGFETQHIFALAIASLDTEAAEAAEALLVSIGFNVEGTDNKIALLIDPTTRDAVLNGPPDIAVAFVEAGFGLNWHNSQISGGNHPGYNAFQIAALAGIADDAVEGQWSPDTKSRAVFDLHRFLYQLNLSPEPPVVGTSQGAFATAWNAWKVEQYGTATPDYVNSDGFAATDAYRQTYDGTPIDDGVALNSEFRLQIVQNLYAETAGILSPEERDNANKSLQLAADKSGQATSAAISLISDLQKRSSTPVTTPDGSATAETLVGKFAHLIPDFIGDESGGVSLDFMIDATKSVISKIRGFTAGFENTLASLGDSVIGEMAKSVNALLVGIGGSLVGDTVEFLNISYDAIKKGLATGDWTDFGQAIVNYGAAAVISALLVTGSVVGASLLVGPIAAAFVAAGWAAYGIYDAIVNGAELIGKITVDLAKVAEKVGDLIDALADDFTRAYSIIGDVIDTAFGETFGLPEFAGADDQYSLVRTYLVDPNNPSRPSSITGGDANERFFGQSNAVIDAGGGDDDIFMKGVGTARGGEGRDVLAGGNAKFIIAGSPIDSGNPNSKIAEQNLALVLDGGKGNDWVLAFGGNEAWTIGGEGRDWIFNTSFHGVIFGDTIDGLISGQGPVLTVEQYDQLEGPANSDNIWWWGSTTMWDPRQGDVLKFFGYPLVGGTNDISFFLGQTGTPLSGAVSLASTLSPIFFDYFLPFFVYVPVAKTNSLYVINSFFAILGAAAEISGIGTDTADLGVMTFRNYNETATTFWGAGFANTAIGALITEDASNLGDLSMVFKRANPLIALLSMFPGYPGGLNRIAPMVEDLLTRAGAAALIAKSLLWSTGTDPLILDLDGDGIETISIDDADVWFDLDNDLFGEKTGWLSGDDGFLVRDLNQNGKIDGISEMFGGPGQSGVAMLAAFDDNGDGRIDAGDAIRSELRVWRDFDGDGATDAGELFTLDALNIVTLNLATTGLNVTTPQGTLLERSAEITFANGSVSRMFDAVFEMNDVDSKFAGEAGLGSWLGTTPISARGFGQVADLGIAMSNDFDLARMVADAAGAMTVPDIRDMRAKAADALGQWGFSLDQTRELTPVLLSADGRTLVDRGVWVEDASGGYWTLQSGAVISDANGLIARPTLAQLLAQGEGWTLEQVWSPSTRPEALVHREAAPYLVTVVNGRAVVLDHGIENADGSWSLASGRPVLDANGVAVAAATKADILAQARLAGQEWRVEALGFNPLAALTVESIGIYQVNGKVIDYTVFVTDELGSFHVWARTLDQALELQDKYGNARGFDLRAYAVDFATLDIVESEDNSAVRVELLTPGQFNFATELSGITFNPSMLTATLNRASGVIAYSVNESGQPSLSPTEYVSGIDAMIGLLDPVMDQYITASRAFALRMAFQGGLSDYFTGIGYDAAKDQFFASTDRALAPVFTAIFEDVPAGTIPATEYLQKWHQILSVMYPDYRMSGADNLFGMSVALDQKFIFQMMLPAWQMVATDLSLKEAMYALGVNQDLLIESAAGADTTLGTSKTNFFLVGDGAESYQGGGGADTYFVGNTFGDVVIEDLDYGSPDELRFTAITSAQVVATRVGQDLILKAPGHAGSVTVKDHFLGELNPSFGKYTEDRSMKSIVFADGVLWDQFRIAMEVSDPKDTNDVIVGSGALDVLNGGRGNDVLEGRSGGDLYIFARGDGQDVVTEKNPVATLPGKGGLDFLQFVGDISADDLHLSRQGEGDDLLIRLMDANGAFTGDTITVEDQFDGMRFNLGAFLGGIDQSLALDHIAPNMIEKFLFEDGSWLDYGQITQRILENARTDGADVIYGFIDADDIDGGKGDDLLIGREGGDTYLFGRGDGRDIIDDEDLSPKIFGSPDDTLRFKDGLTWAHFDFLRVGGSDTLTLRIKGTTDEVVLNQQEETAPFQGFFNLIEVIQFSGETWSYERLFEHYVTLAQTDGNDTVYGFHTADSITGGLGNDRLEGRGGSDTYVWKAGDGNDVIAELAGGSDQLQLSAYASSDFDYLRTSVNLILRFKATGETITLERQYQRDNAQSRAVEAFVFSDRTVLFTDLNPEDIDLVGTSAAEALTGSQFAETIDGGAGDDTLTGGSDGDTYLFDAGYGSDQIIDRQERAAWMGRRGLEKETTDRIIFGPGLSYATAEFARINNDLVITFTNRPDTLIIRNHFRSIAEEIETFQFADQTVTAADIDARLAIVGGNRGDNALLGDATQPNALDGRQGDDTLIGGTATDSYAFGMAYDFDRIVERTNSAGVTDRVVFGEGITADSLVLRRDGTDLLIDLGNAEDVLRIVGGLGTTGIEEFSFADGTLLTMADIRARLLIGSAGNDRLQGFDASNDRLAGGTGTDELIGGTGNDTYVFGHGDGQDSALDGGGTDRIEFGPGVTRDQVSFELIGLDLVIRLMPGNDSLVIFGGADATSNARGIESFVFADGNSLTMGDVQTLIFATTSNGSSDLINGSTIDPSLALRPGAGFDSVQNVSNLDYIFARGDGFDRMTASSLTPTGSITIEDYASGEAIVRLASAGGTDLILSFPETGEGIILVNALSSSTWFPDITFSDGVVLNRAALLQAAVDGQISAGNDRVQGQSGTGFTFDAGLGDDDIYGGSAVDTYLFARGDGRDVITDTGGATDTLRISGYVAADLVVSRMDASRQELILTFAGTDDQVVLRSSSTTVWNGVETITFADGAVRSVADLLAATRVVATSGDDLLDGTAAADTLTGGLGNDTLRGQAAGDTYVYTRGDGVDVIEDTGTATTISLRGYAPGELRLHLDPATGRLVLQLIDGGEITTSGISATGAIQFENGTIWQNSDLTGLIQSTRAPTNAVLNGGFFAETISGDFGDDLIDAGSGADTYIFRRGAGQDRLVDGGSQSNIVRLQGYVAGDVTVLRNVADPAGLTLVFAATGDRLELAYALSRTGSNGTAIYASFVFDDQTLSFADVVQRSSAATAGDDRIEGSAAADRLAGGLGNDLILLGEGADRVIFVRGDGQDEVRTTDLYGMKNDILEIQGYSAAELIVARHPWDPQGIVLRFADTSDSITWRAVTGLSEASLAQVMLADSGTTLTWEQLIALIPGGPNATGTGGDDTLAGTDANDIFEGLAGDDVIDTGAGADRIRFGKGDGQDVVFGKTYADYNFETPEPVSVDGRIAITLRDVTPDDLRIDVLTGDPTYTGPGTWKLTIQSTGDSLLIQNPSYVLTEIAFANGVIWQQTDINAAALIRSPDQANHAVVLVSDDAAAVVMAAGDHYVRTTDAALQSSFAYGLDSGHDVIEALGATGLASDDTLIFTDIASAALEVRTFDGEYDGRMVLTFGALDASLTIILPSPSQDLEQEPSPTPFASIQFADSVILTWADVVAMGETLALNDPARLAGTVTYDRNVDSGLRYLSVNDNEPWNDLRTIAILGAAESDLTYARRGRDLIVSIAADALGNGAGQIVVLDAASLLGLDIQIDGLTVATLGDLMADPAVGGVSAGNDTIDGFGLQGQTETVIDGGAGSDLIFAENLSQPIIEYARGDGHDVIIGAGSLSTIRFADIDAADVTVVVQGMDLVLNVAPTIQGAVDGGGIRLVGAMAYGTLEFYGQVAFAGGEVWSAAEIAAFIDGNIATPGDDVVVDATRAQIYDLGPGDDFVRTRSFNDSYVYRNGDGNDVIDESGSHPQIYVDSGIIDEPGMYVPGRDTLEMPDLLATDVDFAREGDDLLLRILLDAGRSIEAGSIRLVGAFLTSATDSRIVEEIIFADGATLSVMDQLAAVIADAATSDADVIRGSSLADTLRGGAGDDQLDGRLGDDVYIYARGDGHDELASLQTSELYGGTTGVGNILSLTGIAAAQVSAQLDPNGILLLIADTAPGAADGGSILIRAADYADSLTDLAVKRVDFDGGISWSVTELYSRALAGLAGSGDDSLLGSNGDDTLAGETGNDLLFGGFGDDTYVYARGDGIDRIYEATGYVQSNTLRLTGILAADVTLRPGAGTDLQIFVAASSPTAGDGGRIVVSAGLGAATSGIQQIIFDDGTIWARAAFGGLIAASITTGGNDRISGSASADTLEGAGGDDVLLGDLGDDTYLFTRGDGIDQIRDTGGADVLRIAGYTAADLEFSRNGATGADLIIRFDDDNDGIVIFNALTPASGVIERIEFTDTAQVVVFADVLAALAAAQTTLGNDVIVGTNGNDDLWGSRGNDLLAAGSGSDIYRFVTGDGDDRMSDTGTSGTDRLVLDINPGDLIYALRLGADGFDLVLRLPGERDRIILEGALGTAQQGVEEIVFADGTVWNRDAMRNATLVDAQTAGADSLWGYSGADTFTMGVGNDIARGLAGSDTYVVRRGDGADRIVEAVDTASTDIVDFRDYVSSEVSVTQLFKGSDSVQFRFLSSGDTLIVENALASDGSGIESYRFSDGVTWTAANILTRLANTAPEAAADGYFSVLNGQVLTLTTAQLLRNDFDPDGDGLQLVWVDGGAHGAAEIDANGQVIYRPAVGFSGPTQITYTISDGRGGFATGVVDLRVRPVAEVRDDTGFTLAEDGTLQIRAEQLLSNDADGDRMVIGQVRDAVGGTVSLSTSGNITFVADPDFNGTAQFSYVANTPEGGVGTGVVRIAVTAVNDAPVAVLDTVPAFDENTSLVIDASTLLANDSDVDGNTVSLIAVTGNADVTVVLDPDGMITITPRADFFGAAHFDYTLQDSQGATSISRVNLSVTSVNSAPVAGPDSFATDEDVPIFIAATSLLSNDTDADGDTLTILRVEAASGGTAQLYPNGVEFIPRADFHGAAGFRYIISDGQGGETAAWVAVNVISVNDNPDARDDTYSRAGFEELRGSEDQALIIQIADLVNNDSDIEPGSLIFQTASQAVGGTLTLPGNGTIVFTPVADFWGEATFSYLIQDADGAVDAAEVTLFFQNVDDAPPVAVNDTIVAVEDTPRYIPISALLGNDYDIDRDPIILSGFGQALGHSHGTLEQYDATTLLFTPGANATGPTRFYYTISDGIFPDTTGYILFEMQPVNDEPVAGDDTGFMTQQGVPLVLRISELLANDTDIERTVLEFSRVFAQSAGTIEVWQNQFIVVDLGTGFIGPLTVDYEITDGELTDTGRVSASVTAGYNGEVNGTALVDLLIGTAGADTIRGLDGNDTIRTLDGDDLIIGGTGADAIHGGAGFDTVDFALSTIGLRASLATRFGQGGDAQGDEYFAVEAFAGSAFGDTLDGGLDANLLDGRGGDDALSGAAGNDTLLGGDGKDTLTGGAGADILTGGAGSDTADYAGSTDAVTVSLATLLALGGDAAGDVLSSIENLTGGDGNDALDGDGLANILAGGRGNDTLTGRAGDDVLAGGRGADALFGGEGTDIASYVQSETGVLVNLADSAAGGGDAAGDSFAGIEIIEASYHADTLIGDAGDNRLRGGAGGDVIDGGAGFDTADYATAATAVAVDLGTGAGTVGDAAGDVLSGIEQLLGSNWNDTLAGGAADETFIGGLGNDALAGGAGSDTYFFGFGSGNDTLNEAAVTGVDTVVLQAPVLRRDVSLQRDGDDLVIELENTGGFLTDTLRISGHFTGNGTGIEAIAFSEGLIWDRAAIDTLARLGRFNAANDLVRFQTEDVLSIIDPATLLLNDATEGVDDFELVSVTGVGRAAASIDANGMIRFQGALNQNGDSFFDYTVRDAYGRESTARVEVNLTAVNDAPVAENDSGFVGIEDTVLAIRIADLLANDSDVDGDTLTLGSLSALRDLDGNALYASLNFGLTNGRASVSNGFIYFEPRTDHFGFAGFRYALNDGNGGTTFGEVQLTFVGVNDAPNGDDSLTVRLGRVNEISVSYLMLNDNDPEGDAFTFSNVLSGTNGTATLSGDGQTVFFTADALGDAVFTYVLTDTFGASRTITVDLTVRPLNDAPNATNDSLATYEDQVIIIDPATLLGNDRDSNGDPLTIISLDPFALNGRVAFDENGMIVFTPRANYNGVASFDYTISDGQGGTDTATVTVTIEPRNDAPVLRPDVVGGIEDKPIIVLAGETFGNDFDPEGDVLFFSSINFLGVLADMPADRGVDASVGFASDRLANGTTIVATLDGGAALHAWLTFDPLTLEFRGVMPADQTESLSVSVIFILPAALGGLTHTVVQVLAPTDAAALITGLPLATGLALLETEARSLFAAIDDRGVLDGSFNPDTYDFAPGTWRATAPSGRDLPDWITFDAATMHLSVDTASVPQGAGPVTVRVTHLPQQPDLDAGWLSTVDGSFAIDVIIDPAVGVPAAVNALLASQAFFAAQGLFAAPVDGTATVTLANGNPLPAWLAFDPVTLTLIGTPPEGDYVGALDVRFAMPATAGRPAFDLIAEVAVDPVLDTRSAQGFAWQIVNNRVVFTTPEDFDGSFVFTYDAVDTLGAVSADPALVVVNVDGRPEIVDAVADNLVTTSATTFDIPVATLLANDFAAPGNSLRLSAFTQPGVGNVQIVATPIDAATLSGLGQVESAVWSASIAGGGGAPSWLSINPATGQINARLPLDYQGTLTFDVTRTVAGDPPDSDTANFSQALDGTTGAVLRYTLDSDTATRTSFGYTITNDDGEVSSSVVNIAINRNLKANDDALAAVEDTALVINIADLLANDTDTDGDTISFVSLANVTNGMATIANGQIAFTPAANFDGMAGFDYTITDGNGRTDVAHVRINVAPDNVAPVLGRDLFSGTEDTPIEFSVTQLLANDSDANGDRLTFLGLDAPPAGLNVFLLPDGRWQVMPDVNLNGTLTLGYRVTDGRETTTGVIEISLAPVNDGPVLVADAVLQTEEDTTLVIPMAGLLANDYDPEGNAFVVIEVYDPDNGTVTLVNGVVAFTPRADYSGNAGFRYVVEDALGARSEGYAQIQISPAVDAPFAILDQLVMNEDGTLLIDPSVLMANDISPDGDPLVFLGFQSSGVTQEGAFYRFTPQTNANGIVNLTYTITNASGVPVNGILRIDIAPLPDAPIARSDAVTVIEDQILIIDASTLLANDGDPDVQGISITAVGNALGVSVRLLPDGRIEITPDADRTAPASFGYTLTDSSGLATQGQVNVAITGVNDAPVLTAPLSDRLATEETAFTIALQTNLFRDPDGQALTFTLTRADGTAAPAWISFDPLTQTMSGLPPANFTGTLMLRLTASDGQISISDDFALNVLNTQDAPILVRPVADVALDNTGAAIRVGTPFTFAADTAAFSDPDGQPLAYQARLSSGAALPTWLTFNGATFTGTPPATASGTLSITMSASDGSAVVSDTFVLTIAPATTVPYDNVITGSGTITGTALRDQLNGGTGNDTFRDLAGNDDAFGGAGNDTFFAGDGADLFDGGAGNDRVNYSGATAGLTIYMGAPTQSTGIALGDRFVGIEYLYGSNFNDVIVSQGLLRLYGEGGDDVLADGAGAQSLWGGAGRDIFLFVDGDQSQDRIMDFVVGQDAIDLSRWGVTRFDELTIVERTSGAGAPLGELIISFNGESLIVEGLNTAQIPTLNGASFIFANPTQIDPNRWAGATIDGTTGNDLMNGAFRDVDGQGISGGNQTVYGGTGNDTVYDGPGNDRIFGGDGNDIFYNGAGLDTVDGGAGRDELSYAYANGGILFDMTNQTANAGQAAGDRATTIEGLHGSDFSDVIIGGTLATIYGQAGDDYIRDGAGVQQLYGGTGLDTFAFGAGDRASDRVMDFVIGQDKIDISAWAVTSFSQLTITARQTTIGNGTVRSDVLVTFGQETIILDGLTAADRANLTASSFVLMPPATFAAMAEAEAARTTSNLSASPQARSAAPVDQSVMVQADLPVAASMALASSAVGLDRLTFQPANATVAQFGSYATLSSSIAGDGLATGPSGSDPSGATGSTGALVDPATTVTAFLSATQLAALDDNQFSFY
jgi:Ca2+-binding RTX toxin-like protein